MNKKTEQIKALLPDDAALDAVMEKYAVAVTDDVLATIDFNDAHDPVAKQYLPSIEELKITPDELDDPIGDDAYTPVKGIVHRYPDRVLLKPVHVCAVYCRFCFRREKVGPGGDGLNVAEMQAAIGYIKNAPKVWEVIVTGGDPFVMSPRRIRTLMDELNAIPHVEVIRFHTRVPVADPARMTDEMIEALVSNKAVYVVFHANHANELTDKVQVVAKKLIAAGIALLSQTALLKGVNDDAGVLEALFRKLTAMKIKPYYLHHPDKAPGTSHFRLSLQEGQKIVGALLGRLSGIARPHYMLDIPGGFGKIPLEPQRVVKTEDGYEIEDPKGRRHFYKD